VFAVPLHIPIPPSPAYDLRDMDGLRLADLTAVRA
jgi:hypothetical protein